MFVLFCTFVNRLSFEAVALWHCCVRNQDTGSPDLRRLPLTSINTQTANPMPIQSPESRSSLLCFKHAHVVPSHTWCGFHSFSFLLVFPSLFVMPFQELRRQLPQWRSLRGSCPQFDLFFSIWSPILSMMPAWSLLVFSWHVMIFADFLSGFKKFRPFPDLTLTFSVFALFPRHFRSLSTSFSQSWSYECCGTDLQACGREWRAENLGCPDESYTWWHGQTGRNVCHLSAAWSLGSCLSWIRSLNCSAMSFSHEKIAKRLHWLHMELFCCTPHDTSWLRSLQTSRSVSHTGPCMDLASTLSM